MSSVGAHARCGAMGAGNKGAVACSLPIMPGCTLCVINLHLAAGQSDAVSDARARDMDCVLQQLRFEKPGDKGAHRNVFEHDLTIFAGDFNSRMRSGSVSKCAALREEAGFVDFSSEVVERDGAILSFL